MALQARHLQPMTLSSGRQQLNPPLPLSLSSHSPTPTPQNITPRRQLTVRATSAAPPAPTSPPPSSQRGPPRPYAEGDLPVPAWIGDHPVSRVFNLVINSPLYSLMKHQARSTFIGQAEKQGIPWKGIVAELTSAQEELEREKEALEDKSLVYPDYYLKPFHAYEKGNLCWQAAKEVDPATMRLYVRAIIWESDVLVAESVFRQAWIDTIKSHHARYSGGLPVDSILDVGCSTGVSTRTLARAFPDAKITGLDASPYFLSVASFRSKQMSRFMESGMKGGVTPHGSVVDAALALVPNPVTVAERGVMADETRVAERIEWKHGLGEDTKLPGNSLSMVSLAFMIHECPAEAIRDLSSEAFRILKPGGTISMTDNSPTSKVIQSIPTPIAAMMKTTEPHSDSYYQCDLQQLWRDLGFVNVSYVLSDPRHRVVTATKPLSF